MKARQIAVDCFKAQNAAFIYPENMGPNPLSIFKSSVVNYVKGSDPFKSDLQKAEKEITRQLCQNNLIGPTLYVTRKSTMRRNVHLGSLFSDAAFNMKLHEATPSHKPSAYYWTPVGWKVCELMRTDLFQSVPENVPAGPFEIPENVRSQLLDSYFDHQIVIRCTEAQVYSGDWKSTMRRLGSLTIKGRTGNKPGDTSWSEYGKEVVAFIRKARLAQI